MIISFLTKKSSKYDVNFIIVATSTRSCLFNAIVALVLHRVAMISHERKFKIKKKYYEIIIVDNNFQKYRESKNNCQNRIISTPTRIIIKKPLLIGKVYFGYYSKTQFMTFRKEIGSKCLASIDNAKVFGLNILIKQQKKIIILNNKRKGRSS